MVKSIDPSIKRRPSSIGIRFLTIIVTLFIWITCFYCAIDRVPVVLVSTKSDSSEAVASAQSTGHHDQFTFFF